MQKKPSYMTHFNIFRFVLLQMSATEIRDQVGIQKAYYILKERSDKGLK